MIQPTPQVEFAIAELKKAMPVFPQLAQMVYQPILDHFARLEHVTQGMAKELNETDNVLGKVLGYPLDPDGDGNLIGPGYCIGDNTTVSVAMQAADRIEKVEQQRAILLGTLNAIGDLFEYRYATKTPAELKAEVLSAIDAGTGRLKKTTGKLPVCAI